MNQQSRAEARPVAKAQKTMMVPEDLYRLIAEQERRAGATFTRQAIAAFMQYFFTDPLSSPDHLWMRAAIAVENGEISMADAPKWVAVQRALQHKMELDDARENDADKDDIRELSAQFCESDQVAGRWDDVAELGDNTISGLIRLWALEDHGLETESVLMAVDKKKFSNNPSDKFKPGEEGLITDPHLLPPDRR